MLQRSVGRGRRRGRRQRERVCCAVRPREGRVVLWGGRALRIHQRGRPGIRHAAPPLCSHAGGSVHIAAHAHGKRNLDWCCRHRAALLGLHCGAVSASRSHRTQHGVAARQRSQLGRVEHIVPRRCCRMEEDGRGLVASHLGAGIIRHGKLEAHLRRLHRLGGLMTSHNGTRARGASCRVERERGGRRFQTLNHDALPRSDNVAPRGHMLGSGIEQRVHVDRHVAACLCLVGCGRRPAIPYLRHRGEGRCAGAQPDAVLLQVRQVERCIERIGQDVKGIGRVESRHINIRANDRASVDVQRKSWRDGVGIGGSRVVEQKEQVPMPVAEGSRGVANGSPLRRRIVPFVQHRPAWQAELHDRAVGIGAGDEVACRSALHGRPDHAPARIAAQRACGGVALIARLPLDGDGGALVLLVCAHVYPCAASVAVAVLDAGGIHEVEGALHAAVGACVDGG